MVNVISRDNGWKWPLNNYFYQGNVICRVRSVIKIRPLLPHVRRMTFMESVLKEVGTAYLSRVPGFTPCIWWGHVAHLFIFLCCVGFVFGPSPVSRVPNITSV